MDADTRHQLKQNELAQALNWLRDLNDTRTRYALLGVALLAVLVLAGYAWHRSRQRALARSWNDLGQIVMQDLDAGSADKLSAAQDRLHTIIADTSNPNVAGYAKLSLAKAYTEQAFADTSQRPKGFEEAARLLEEVTADPKADPMLRGAAMYALASDYESLRQPDKAKTLYTTLTTDATFDGSPYKTKAADRLNTMDETAVNIAFTPGAEPVASQPAGQSAFPTPLVPPDLELPKLPTSQPAPAGASEGALPVRPALQHPPESVEPPAAPATQPATQGAGQTP